jgi:uncharacterized protein YbjQ (UPF0145 family)
MTTATSVEGQRVREYPDVVTGECIVDANIIIDFLVGIRDIFGGRVGAYKNSLRDARQTALAELSNEARNLGAGAVIGIDLDYQALGKEGSMVIVTATGTAIKLS